MARQAQYKGLLYPISSCYFTTRLKLLLPFSEILTRNTWQYLADKFVTDMRFVLAGECDKIVLNPVDTT